ncbi:MAG TPA: hypothetical protein VFT53_01245 [Candidatus Saccharimonadales bacterium]|nr:hypothetical protein [Candidatus Saccharimonadales bacterium]
MLPLHFQAVFPGYEFAGVKFVSENIAQCLRAQQRFFSALLLVADAMVVQDNSHFPQTFCAGRHQLPCSLKLRKIFWIFCGVAIFT